MKNLKQTLIDAGYKVEKVKKQTYVTTLYKTNHQKIKTFVENDITKTNSEATMR